MADAATGFSILDIPAPRPDALCTDVLRRIGTWPRLVQLSAEADVKLKLALLRDGQLTTAKVLAPRARATDIVLELPALVICSFDSWFEPPVGTTIRVLELPRSRNPYLVAFDDHGRMHGGVIERLINT